MVRQNVVLDPADLAIPAPLLLLLRRLRAGIDLIGGGGCSGSVGDRCGLGSRSRRSSRCLQALAIAVSIAIAIVAVERGRTGAGVEVQHGPLLEQLEGRSVVPLEGFDLDEVPPQMLDVRRLTDRFRGRCGGCGFRERRKIVRSAATARFDDLLEELDGVLGGPDGFAPGLGQMGRRLL